VRDRKLFSNPLVVGSSPTECANLKTMSTPNTETLNQVLERFSELPIKSGFVIDKSKLGDVQILAEQQNKIIKTFNLPNKKSVLIERVL
jgi:hypothetical protein